MRLFALLFASSLALAACDSASPPETVTGRWEGTATLQVDSTYSGRFNGVNYSNAAVRILRSDAIQLTIVDNAGQVSGNLNVATTQSFSLRQGSNAESDTTESKYALSVTGIYAPPFLEITAPRAREEGYTSIEFEVRGDEGTAPLTMDTQPTYDYRREAVIYGGRRTVTLRLRRVD
jgi:hypothetical protein